MVLREAVAAAETGAMRGPDLTMVGYKAMRASKCRCRVVTVPD